MNDLMARRLTMATLGGSAGLALYGLTELADAKVLEGRLLLLVSVMAGTFFGNLLIMAGPLRPLRAAIGAAIVAIVLALLLVLASLRFDTVEEMFEAPHVILAALVLATVPMPFWIAESLGRWRDYPVLFGEAWSIVVRYAVGWTFAGVVWAVIFLSDALLDIVGVTIIGDLIDLDPVPFLVTGGVLGLGLAVVQELQDYVSPYLILRLLRLLLPVVLAVTAVFLLALPVQGMSGLFRGLSVALTMLAMAGAGTTLVTTAVDQDDQQATESTILIWSARGMAVLLPVLALVGAWAIWLRVDQHGWSPDRLLAAQVAFLAIGYGGLYALAVLRGKGWTGRIRQANVFMAIVLLGLATISLTPILNAESISARSHLGRFVDGSLAAQDLDLQALGRWGKAGDEALAELKRISVDKPDAALAERLANPSGVVTVAPDSAVLAEAADAVVLQPPSATAIRDMALSQMDRSGIEEVKAACLRTMPGGGPGCVMVVADFLTEKPGEEAILALWHDGGFVSFESFVQGEARFTSSAQIPGTPTFGAEAEALIREWQSTPPPVEPAPMNRLVGSKAMIVD